MTFHRVTPFLRPAVASILGQTLRDLELILVDNGTGTGLDSLGELGRDPRVRLISNTTNLREAPAQKMSRGAARGEFIALMDSDDIALPTRLEKQLAVLRAEPRLGLLTTHALAIDEAGTVLRPQFTLSTEDEQRVYTAYSLPVTNPTVAGRREVFDQFPMRDWFEVSSDYDFFTRVIEAHPCRTLPEVLLHYRIHPGQVTVSEYPMMVLNACVIRLLTARRRAGREEDFESLTASLSNVSGQPPPPLVTYAHFARLALDEGFPLLAVFLARRCVVVRRSVPVMLRAGRVLAKALRSAPRQAPILLRMFLTGPVRTHGLRPLGG